MKFQDLVLISELYEQPITVPGADPLKDIEQAGFEKIGSLVNHLVNPVQVAIDSYNLGTSIADAFGQYQADPTPGNALGFVALAGLGLITLKSGTGGEAGEIRALVNDIATQRDEIAKVASTIKLSETLNKLFTPARIEELAALKGMPKKELDDMLKATLSAAKIATKEGKDAVKALPRDAKGRFISPTTVAPAATVTPATAATKLVSRTPTSSTFRPTTPAQRAKNTELSQTMVKARAETPALPAPGAAAPATATAAPRMSPEDKRDIINAINNKGITGAATRPFRWLGSLTKDQYSKIDPETKTLIASFVLGLPSAAIGFGAGYSAANSETGRQLKAFLSTPVGEMFKPSMQQQLKTLTGKRDKLAQSLGSAGWRPEQVKRLTASLDSQIKQMQELGIQ